jgi:hypothetical protein
MTFTHILDKSKPDNFAQLGESIAKLDPSKRWVFKVTAYEKNRTLEQNDQAHVWYEQLAIELPEDNALGWKCYCKLHFGVPILRAEDEEFRKVYDQSIKSMSYEHKLQVMKILPVTSIMKTKQYNQYFEAMQDEFLKRGVKLEFITKDTEHG